MKTLTIECSGSQGSVSLSKDEEILEHRTFPNPRGRGSEVFSILEEVVSSAQDIDSVLVGTGPGSYNALRSSIAAAWGIAKARDATLGGICSLLGYEAEEYYVIGDARANQWFFGHVKAGCLVVPIELLTPADAQARLQSGIPVYTTGAACVEAIPASPDACWLSRHINQAGAAEPIYLKPPHITKSRREAGGA